MAHQIGDKVVIRLGAHRGRLYEIGILPKDMLPDGTIVTIKALHDSKNAYSFIAEDTNFSYPLSLLFPMSTKKY